MDCLRNITSLERLLLAKSSGETFRPNPVHGIRSGSARHAGAAARKGSSSEYADGAYRPALLLSSGHRAGRQGRPARFQRPQPGPTPFRISGTSLALSSWIASKPTLKRPSALMIAVTHACDSSPEVRSRSRNIQPKSKLGSRLWLPGTSEVRTL